MRPPNELRVSNFTHTVYLKKRDPKSELTYIWVNSITQRVVLISIGKDPKSALSLVWGKFDYATRSVAISFISQCNK